MSYIPTFVDAQQQHRQHPRTFWAPCEHELNEIRPGWYIKAGFHTSHPAVAVERMWVQVSEVHVDGFSGHLANDPVFVPLKCDTPVFIGRQHVMQIASK